MMCFLYQKRAKAWDFKKKNNTMNILLVILLTFIVTPVVMAFSVMIDMFKHNKTQSHESSTR